MSLAATGVGRMVAALCVVLCAVLSVQFAVTTLDRIEHGLALDHTARFDAGMPHIDTAADHHADALVDDDHGPESLPHHHHHGSEHQVARLDVSGWGGVVLSGSRYQFFLLEPHPGSTDTSGLERPPRPVIQHTV